MSLTTARLRTLIWVLIYGGLVVAGLGVSVRRSDDLLGWTIVASGGIAVAIGAVLIWVRSRIDDSKETA